MKVTPEIYRKAYELAKSYLPSQRIEGVTCELIEKYQNEPSSTPKPASKKEIYKYLLYSAQEMGMKPTVIGKAIGGVERLAPILNDFDPDYVVKTYGDDWQAVLIHVEEKLNPYGKIRKTPRSIWPRYCQTIISAAEFIKQFDSADDFFKWVDSFDRDDRSRAGLPMLLDHEIKGFGFALSCDFLMKLGYSNFSKPDVHLRDIFTALELCQVGVDDYHLFKTIISMAKSANVTPYATDKLFWLIGSGYFYNDPFIGSNGRIGSHKQKFIKFVRSKLFAANET
jgi:hypothetical protein